MELLIIVKGNDQGRQIEISGESVTIGRWSENSIQLHDVEISRRHAEIRTVGTERKIFDLNSSNGVYVNSVKVKEHSLSNGDQIQIGRTLLVYMLPTRSPDGEEENPPVDISQERSTPEQSRIVHSYKQDEEKDLFQIDAMKAIQSEWFNKARAHLRLIYHTTLVVSQTLDIDRLLNRIMELIFDWVEIDRGCILLYNQEENMLVPKVSRRRNQESTRRLTIRQAIIDYVVTKKEGVLTNESPREVSADSIARLGVREAICIPMLGRYGLVGVIYIDITDNIARSGQDASSTPDSAPVAALGVEPIADSLSGIDADATIEPDAAAVIDATIEPERNADDGENIDAAAPVDSSISHKLTPDHLKLMFAIGHQAALAVEDTQYYLAMVQSERLAAVGQTVAVLSHHIKNILQGIRGGSYLIEKGLSAHDESMVGKGWGIVDKNQNKISDLILDMLTFSKKRTPVFDFDDINRIVADVTELMQGRCLDLDVTLTSMPGENLPEFYFDSEQIHRALTNLVTNAIDAVRPHGEGRKKKEDTSRNRIAAPEPFDSATAAPTEIITAVNDPEDDANGAAADLKPGHVEIATSYDPERNLIIVTVDDNGPGVPPELRDELFRPFFSKSKSSGTGLGLAVTNKIVQEHKGRVRVTDSPSGGARFIVELPRLDMMPADEEE